MTKVSLLTTMSKTDFSKFCSGGMSLRKNQDKDAHQISIKMI